MGRRWVGGDPPPGRRQWPAPGFKGLRLTAGRRPKGPIPIWCISCPESQTIASPDHGITFCNGPARTSRAFSHGPTLANADWHRKTSDNISGYWQGDHCHTLGVGCLAEAFYLTAQLWPELSIDTVTSDQFTLPATSAFASHTSHAQECVHSWRLPPTRYFILLSPSFLNCFQVRNFCWHTLPPSWPTGHLPPATTPPFLRP